jgi:hypothetical protein
MEGEREILSVPSGLMCPLSYDRMKDPVMLIPSGNTYDREQICNSLLHYPNLDPSSNVRYDSKLQYCANLAVSKLLMETYGDKAFQKYDDSGFQARYEMAWNSGNVGAALAARAAAAAPPAAREPARRERERGRRALEDPLMFALFGSTLDDDFYLYFFWLFFVYFCVAYLVFIIVFIIYVVFSLATRSKVEATIKFCSRRCIKCTPR